MAVFMLNIAASFVAGIVLLALASAFSTRARWVITATLGRLLDIDTEYVFNTPQDAASDVQKELARAKSVDLFTSRGNELQRETFA